MIDIQTIDNEFCAATYGRTSVVFDHASGATLFDAEGRSYIDFGSGIGVMSLGYGHPAWVEAVKTQAEKLPHTSNLYYSRPTALLAQKLCERTGFKRVFFSNSGAEANECLIKTARKWANDTKGEGVHPIVTLRNSFHGRTIATVTATGQDVFHTHFGPFPDGFLYVPANDIAALEKVLKEHSCAAFLFEVVQGEGGVCALNAQYMKAAQELCKKHNVLLCIDEVQTGNGRTGTWFAFEQFGLSPDIVSTAKGLGGGLPIGATLFGEQTAQTLTAGTHGSTFGGNPIACAAALAVLETLSSDALDDVRRKAQVITTTLSALPTVRDVSGLGMMIGFSVEGKKSAEVRAAALKEGLLVLTAKDRVRLLPPLTISDEELQTGLQRLCAAISA